MLGERRAGGRQRARLGHAPGVQHVGAEQVVELLDRGARRGRAAAGDHLELESREVGLGLVRFDPGDEVEPDGRDAERLGDPLVLHQHIKAFRVELRTGQHHLGARHRPGERQAPGVGVEQRHHHQNGIARGQRQRVGAVGGEAMQQRRAVAVKHALGIAGRAGRVAERAGGVFVETRPDEIWRAFRQQILVAQQIGDLGVRHVVAVAKRDPAFDQRQVGRERTDERGEDGIEAHIGVFGVVHDVTQLLGKQARIDRVQHEPRAGDAIVDFEMAIGVPGERRDAVARVQAKALQRMGEPPGARGDVAVTGAIDDPVGIARDDFAVGVETLDIFENSGNQKRTVLHKPEHA